MAELMPSPELRLADAQHHVQRPSALDQPKSTLDAPMNARKEEDVVSLHHTLIPRTLTVTGFFLLFSFPAAALMLNDAGHLKYSNRVLHFDEQARRIIYVTLGGTALCLLVGWMWWGINAARNARLRTRWAVSPLFVPICYLLVSVGFIIAAVSQQRLGDNGVYAKAGAVVFAAAVYFATLGAYSKTAAAVGSSSKYFTRLIAIPWVVGAVVGVVAFFSRYLSDPARLGLFLAFELVQGLYGLTMYQAMTSFDRACVGTRLKAQDDDAVANFLKFVR